MFAKQQTLVVAQFVAKLSEHAEAARQRGKRGAEEISVEEMVAVFFRDSVGK